MKQKESMTRYVSFAVVIMTFVGIALHDTKLDAMTRFAIALPAVMAAYEGATLLHALGGDSHTHVERVSGKDLAKKNTSSMPRIQGRRDEEKKYRQNKGEPQGRGSFDEYYFPLAV